MVQLPSHPLKTLVVALVLVLLLAFVLVLLLALVLHGLVALGSVLAKVRGS